MFVTVCNWFATAPRRAADLELKDEGRHFEINLPILCANMCFTFPNGQESTRFCRYFVTLYSNKKRVLKLGSEALRTRGSALSKRYMLRPAMPIVVQLFVLRFWRPSTRLRRKQVI